MIRRVLRAPSRVVRALAKRARIAGLWVSAVLGTSRVVGDVPVVVSMTTYGHRVPAAGIALESIARGRRRPERLVLWMAPADLARPLPLALRALRRRGLEIIACEDYRSHKKYYPAAMEHDEILRPLATADDDALYPADWLDGLWRAHTAHPQNVVGYRSKVIGFDAEGKVRPYAEWRMNESDGPSCRVFMTGISGVLYPVAVLEEARRHGTAFMELCPFADDLWLHRSAIRAGCPPRQVSRRARDFPGIPGTQRTALMRLNVDRNANDTQLAQTYTEEDLAAIRASEPPQSAPA